MKPAGIFASVTPTSAELAASRAGDEIVEHPDVVMDRAFSVPGSATEVWPWLIQLGKRRAGWYFPRIVERFIPQSHRGLRSIDDTWQHLQVGDVIPDYGGQHATFQAESVDAPSTLVYSSLRGRTRVSWSITVSSTDAGARLHFRLRLGPVKRVWLANSVGGLFDLLTIAGLAAGLRERLRETTRS
jgi:hypothetical protein